MKTLSTVILTAVVATGAVLAREPATALKEAGVTGGLVVHLGCGGGETTAALRISDVSYAKTRMKAKTFESRVLEIEASSLKTEY